MWFNKAVEMAARIEVTPCVPRSVGHQTQRNNVPASNPEEYFKRAITIPFLDHIMQELNSR